MQYLMALDAGSGNCRSIIFTVDGREMACSSREWLHPTLPEYPGSQVFDTGLNWRLMCESIREALEKSGVSPLEIAAVSATSIRFGSVLYDAEGKELWAAPNTDSRASDQVIEAVENGLFDRFYAITGDGFTLSDVMRWRWVKKNLPELWEKAVHFTLISDWILYRLTGEFVSDPSIAASSGLFDIFRGTWSEELADIFGIRLGMCPRVGESGAVIGTVHEEAAKQSGLAPGTPVVIGGGDTMAGLIGTGGVEANVTTVIGGTHWQQTFLSDRSGVDPHTRVRVSPHMVPGLWMFETNAVFIGLAMRWFRDAFCQEEKKGASAAGTDAYVLMEELARKAPPCAGGLTALFANLFDVRNWVHGPSAFMQFDVTAGQRFGKGEFIRVIEEDAAFQSLGNLTNIWEATGFEVKPSTEIVFAGGASKGFLWPQILADVTGKRVRVPVVKEATALGTVVCAGVGIGAYRSISDGARRLVKWERELTPDGENAELYRRSYRRWRELYRKMLELTDLGLVRPMWKPAGAVQGGPGRE
jgi:autoinducer 2 (AI-2) kinase